jgi:phosphoribosyl 1,2-cyclic phosphodiesterase
MLNLKNIFKDDEIIRLDTSLFEIEKYQKDSDVKVFNINIDNQVKDYKSLMIDLYDSCEFGEHFGANWDAVSDCLIEYDNPDIKTYIFIFHHFSSFISADKNSAKTFISIFKSAIDTLWEIEVDNKMCLLLLE